MAARRLRQVMVVVDMLPATSPQKCEIVNPQVFAGRSASGVGYKKDRPVGGAGLGEKWRGARVRYFFSTSGAGMRRLASTETAMTPPMTPSETPVEMCT